MLDIANIYNKEVFCHPLCFLRIIGLKRNCKISVNVLTNKENSSRSYDVNNNFYNALLMLKKGENLIEIRYETQILKRIVYFRPHMHDKFVKLVYITCLDTDTFQCMPDEEGNTEEAIKKIQTAGLLLQTYTAETISHEKFGRRTFQLELLENGYPQVTLIQLPYTLMEANNMTQIELWETIALEILSSPLANTDSKFLAIYCGTRYANSAHLEHLSELEILSSTQGHISLGGGGLAVVGSGAMYSWASCIDEAMDAMKCKTKIDTKYVMDFSAGRHTWGHAYGTHLGSVLHELAHTFNIGHTEEGIMSRGFEDIHLFFVCKEIYNDYMFSCKVNKKIEAKNIVQKEAICFTADFVCEKDVNKIKLGLTLPAKDGIDVATSQSANHLEVTRGRDGGCLGRAKNFGCLREKFPSVTLEKERKLSVEENSCRACWERVNAVLLAYHPWITGTQADGAPTLKGSVLKSEAGIRLIELRDTNMMTFYHWEFTEGDPPTIFHMPWAKVPYWPPSPYIEVFAIDNASRLLTGCCITRPL